ncbi:hypothetical protein [Streptosporangium sp. NBC_01756]|uniref:hypothetical protein n=1 Tax=Streptosporangium sp. NBC_01756 TaxID=2975950 RepID=UPI002DDC54B6|nr:hypothetical protein [Streptosporangium sp. NBC_01756]WSC82929.1 hypothetical protein OIE48_21085 [Streptosporangium sp. NBC_01756]
MRSTPPPPPTPRRPARTDGPSVDTTDDIAARSPRDTVDKVLKEDTVDEVLKELVLHP